MTIRLRHLPIAVLLLLTACGGGTPTAPATPSAPITPPATTGTLGLTVGGLPTGTSAAITITGPASYSSTATATQDIASLTPGSYTVTAAAVTVGTTSYTATPATQTVAVTANTKVTATVTYAVSGGAPSGRLIVTLTGLPAGATGNVIVTGPTTRVDTVRASPDTLTGLTAGTYTLAAGTATNAATSYTPTPATQTVTVGATPATATVAYAASGAVSLNLTVDAAYLVQTVQTVGQGVALVAGKNAWVRVFARATEANTVRPNVRVRLYRNGTLVQTYTVSLTPGSTGTPTTVDESSIPTSWNVAVPGALVQPGLAILADVDPTNAVPEANETDNTYPANGTPLPLTVRTVPTFSMRFVPIVTPPTSLTGSVSAATAASYLTFFKVIWPIATIDADVRATYTSTDTASLTSSNTNGTWGKILGEIYALRTADASNRDYYGVVGTNYNSGVAGIGYVGAPAAIGWDKAGTTRAAVAAHELGHNFGRNHAPCGGVASPDPNYPYSGGTTGVWGFDVARADSLGITATGILHPTTNTDLMGYCSSQWVSDYNYNGVLTFVAGAPAIAAAALSAVQPSLVVWGRINNGQVTLEPAFEATTHPSLPSGRGNYVLEGFDAAGVQLFSWAFDGTAVDHDDGARHFAFALPLDGSRRDRLATLRVRGAGQVAEQRSSAATASAMLGARALRTPAGSSRAEVTWDASQYPLAVVRDAVTGEILSLARGGAVTVVAPSGQVRVDLSDGVRTIAADAP
jgi:hypothetical protein